MYNLIRKLKNLPFVGLRLKQLHALTASGLPIELLPALRFLVTHDPDEQTKKIIRKAENRRAEIASHGDEEISIWYSPKPGSAGENEEIAGRPRPGEFMKFSMKRIARTGKDMRWGAVLYLLAREFQAERILELGTCAGISAIYLSGAECVKEMLTVEGSSELCRLARESVGGQANARIINSLFDDAIDSELPTMSGLIDLAFIDGHHEKIATLHYFNRVRPFMRAGALVVFDDISWSYDMRDAWLVLSKKSEFSHALDLGTIGVCIMRSPGDATEKEPRYWDLQPIVGKVAIGDPHGWKRN